MKVFWEFGTIVSCNMNNKEIKTIENVIKRVKKEKDKRKKRQKKNIIKRFEVL